MAKSKKSNKKPNKSSKEITSITKEEIEKVLNKNKSSRVRRNTELYQSTEEIKITQLSVTKQQKFNFDNSDLEDEIDTSFIDRKPRKKKEIIVEKKVYPVKILVFLSVFLLSAGAFITYHYLTFDHNKVKVEVKEVEKEVVPENIVFLGDSITHAYDLEKYYEDYNTVNSGVDGNLTNSILDEMEERVYRYNPSKVFLLIGTNDIAQDKSVDEISSNIEKIVKQIKENRPAAEIYVESVYPINKTDDEKVDSNVVNNRNNDKIKELNEKIKEIAEKEEITYIDMYDVLKDDDDNLKLEYTREGLHLIDKGYEVITEKIKEYLK